MPNIKSSIKRARIAEKRNAANTSKRSALKTSVKKVKESISKKDANTEILFKSAVKTIDKAAAHKLIHKNTAARKISRLAKALNASVAAKS